MKKYLKEIVFSVHVILFAICLIPFCFHNDTLNNLAIALLVINFLVLIWNIIYFFESNFFQFSIIISALFIFIFYPLWLRDIAEKKEIDKCSIELNIALDTVISHPNRGKSNACDRLEAHYFVKGVHYNFGHSVDYNSGFKKGDSVSIVYSCKYPEIKRMLFYSCKDSSWHYEEKR